MQNTQPTIGLFASCLVDLSGPAIGFAAARLLKDAKCNVHVPVQSCCGQPAYNNGNHLEAIEIAKSTIKTFEGFDHLIVPSASCAGMIKYHYPTLFTKGTNWHQRAANVGARTYELIDYLYKVRGVRKIKTEFKGRVAYHESCSARREMKVKGATELLSEINGIDLIELPNNEECCGFGGLFSVKYAALSNSMVEAKLAAIQEADIDLLTGVDLGCLHNIAGKLSRCGVSIKVRHIAELLSPR